jgi:hypothetical protein
VRSAVKAALELNDHLLQPRFKYDVTLIPRWRPKLDLAFVKESSRLVRSEKGLRNLKPAVGKTPQVLFLFVGWT